MKERILVTGGAGFIGSHIVDALIEKNCEVYILDNLSTGSVNNLAHVKNNITFIQADIRDKKNCIKAARACTAIIHCAALVSVEESCNNPITCFDINTQGTENMLYAAVKNNVQRFIFSSSSAVYGDHAAPCTETDECAPLSPYGYSKWMSEHLCREYAALYNIHAVSLRYFNVFGPRQKSDSPYSGVIAQFSQLMRQNLPITVYGDGTQTRDFVSVNDIVHANLHFALEYQNQLKGDVFNIASGISTSINALIQKLQIEFSHFTASINYQPARSGDIQHSRANCSKYHSLHKQEKVPSR